jgi:hypothetical protein
MAGSQVPYGEAADAVQEGPTMTMPNVAPTNAVLVAIDVAKHRNEVLIEEPGRSRRRRLTILNCRDDHDRFVETLGAYGHPVVAGFEATGNYHRPLAHRLLGAGVELRLIPAGADADSRWGFPRR